MSFLDFFFWRKILRWLVAFRRVCQRLAHPRLVFHLFWRKSHPLALHPLAPHYPTRCLRRVPPPQAPQCHIPTRPPWHPTPLVLALGYQTQPAGPSKTYRRAPHASTQASIPLPEGTALPAMPFPALRTAWLSRRLVINFLDSSQLQVVPKRLVGLLVVGTLLSSVHVSAEEHGLRHVAGEVLHR